ncbi:MAG: cytochrome-c oxidase, cbb3-type subunit II [Leptospirales bacterium]|jgi:cytochrome c oxidase cbb3-type subunit 2
MSKIFDSISTVESRGILFPVLVTFAVLIGGLVEVVPPFFLSSTVTPIESVKPYAPLELAGRDVYIREGCNNCHSQLIRPFKWETDRFDPTRVYGDAPYSKGGEYVYDHPHLWGSKRTGPDLHHESQIQPSADWHRRHFINPRDTSPGSIMPAYPWLFDATVDGESVAGRMKSLRILGVPYTDAEINGAPAAVAGKSEGDALIAYMLKLGRDTANLDQAEEAAK